jgi:type IV secretion system protein VirB8
MKFLFRKTAAPEQVPTSHSQLPLDFATANDWHAEKYSSALASRNRWLLAAAIASTLALLCLVALIGLTPLKTVEPYVVKEESSSGLVTVLRPVREEGITAGEALKKYFLAQYVRARETFDPQDIRHAYQSVMLFSDIETGRDYDRWINPENPNSPVAAYGPKKIKRFISIRSITFLAPDTAQLRFTARERMDTSERPSFWIATIQFHFVQHSADEEERLINPVGFKVTSYRIDPEVTK